MFICRSSLLTPIQQLHLQPQDFPIPDKEHVISLPHMVEVALGAVIVAQGYSIRDVYTPYICRWARRLLSYIQIFIYGYILLIKRTKKGALLVKFCKIPIYYKKNKAK